MWYCNASGDGEDKGEYEGHDNKEGDKDNRSIKQEYETTSDRMLMKFTGNDNEKMITKTFI